MTTRIRVSKDQLISKGFSMTGRYDAMPDFLELEGEVVEVEGKCCENCYRFMTESRDTPIYNCPVCPCHSKGTEEKHDIIKIGDLIGCDRCKMGDLELRQYPQTPCIPRLEGDCNYGCNEKYQMVQCKVHNPKPVAPTKRKIEKLNKESYLPVYEDFAEKINEIIRFLNNEDGSRG